MFQRSDSSMAELARQVMEAKGVPDIVGILLLLFLIYLSVGIFVLIAYNAPCHLVLISFFFPMIFLLLRPNFNIFMVSLLFFPTCHWRYSSLFNHRVKTVKLNAKNKIASWYLSRGLHNYNFYVAHVWQWPSALKESFKGRSIEQKRKKHTGF